MKCKHCGKSMKKNGYCPRCGEFVAEGDGRVSLAGSAQQKKKKLTKKQLWIRIGIISLSVLLALSVAVISVVYAYLGRINRESEMSGDLHINEVLPTEDVQNIALFGTDSRQDNNSGRSDAIVILTIDRKHNMIKLASIARDTYVDIPGRGYDKINHAYAFGKAPLAVKTINKNFNLNITDYVYINFFEFVELIDYIGGVDIDVNESEMHVMNSNYLWYQQAMGMDFAKITHTGMQHLNGAQALAYSRNRYTGGDTGRGNRHREVLEAMFVAVKDLPITKFPALIGKVMEMCHTTMTDSELMGLATWALTANPGFGSQSLPTKECNPRSGSAAMINGVWYYIYDLDIATNILHKFIYEDDAQHFPTATRTMPVYTTGALGTTTTPSATDPSGTTTDPSATTTDPSGTTTDTDPSATVDPTATGDPTSTTDPSGTDNTTIGDSDTDPTTSTEPSDIQTTTTIPTDEQP